MPISRRDFLKISSGAIFGGGLGIFYLKHPDFFKKVWNSLSTGKALIDIDEIIQSRLNPDKKLYKLGEPVDYVESWMKNVCAKSIIYSVPEIEANIGFFDITDTCEARPTKEILVDKVLTVNNEEYPYPHSYFSLSQTLGYETQQSLTLPLPIYDNNEGIDRYAKYALYAGCRNGLNFDTRASLENEPSARYGGLAIVDGKTIITTPDEFKTINQSNLDTQALIQYGFVVDSSTLNADLENISKSKYYDGVTSLKDQVFTTEYGNCLVTIYDSVGNMRTFLMSTFSPYNETAKIFGKKPGKFNIPQLIGLVSQFINQQGFDRFVIAFPDASNISANVYTPISYSPYDKNIFSSIDDQRIGGVIGNNEINEEGGGDENVGKNMVKVFRTLGESSDKYIYPFMTFPFIITSSKRV